MEWYTVNNVQETDSPALLVYPDRARQNISAAIEMVKDPKKLRPHVKTNKIAEVCRMMMEQGIDKFKCATIAEAEMLATIGAPDVLLAYQPVGPKASRLLSLVNKYPGTIFSCVVDNATAARHIAAIFAADKKVINVMIDMNSGMNRTGIHYENAIALFEQLLKLPSLNVSGVHVYDGHIRETDLAKRQAQSDAALNGIFAVVEQIEKILSKHIDIVAGGSPTFATHAKRNVQSSPGTFVFWDWGYKHQFPDFPFEYAALVLSRIISITDDTHITTDLGNKSVASEGPQPRVHFLNAPDAEPISHSEEHMVLKVPDSSIYTIGQELYGVPVHVCPTVALYEKANVVDDHLVHSTWRVVARDRAITV